MRLPRVELPPQKLGIRKEGFDDMTEKEILARYMPEAAVELVFQSITHHRIHLKITRGRKTKHGDYRPPIRHANHRISINHDLNKYAFLITYIHELAHLVVFEKHKNRVAPHGREWKQAYRDMMSGFLKPEIFPDDILAMLERSIKNSPEGIPTVKASTTSDINLSRVLQQYDQTNGHTRIEELPDNAIFTTQNGRQFKKGERVRTRYKCKNLQNKKLYLFHPLTPVIPVK